MSNLSDLIRDRFGVDTNAGKDTPADGPLATIIGRRSYRRYRDEAVPDNLMNVLLAAAQSASAKSDLQQLSIIHVTDPDLKAKLAELSSTKWMATAPVLLMFCGDIRRAQQIAAFRKLPYGQNTLDSFMNAAIDAALAMQTFMLAAEAIGIGTCPISQVRNRIDEVAELLGMPPGVFPICGLTAGYPDEQRDVTLRLPPETVIHKNKYDDSALEEQIDGYDQRRHAIRPIAEGGYMHVEKFGSPEFYGWSENVARRLSGPEGREVLRPFLEGHGFDLT